MLLKLLEIILSEAVKALPKSFEYSFTLGGVEDNINSYLNILNTFMMDFEIESIEEKESKLHPIHTMKFMHYNGYGLESIVTVINETFKDSNYTLDEVRDIIGNDG